MKKRIVLFQPYLRKHVLNFGKYLKNFEFIVKNPMRGNFYNTLPPSYEKEISRIKTSRINKLRRFFGIPNVRLRLDRDADIFFTYGCLLFTRTPYCVYIENGIALYNYDNRIASNAIARFIISFLIRQPSCKYLIFMSDASYKSFFSTVPYSKRMRSTIEKKSIKIYPLIDSKSVKPKKFSEKIKLLFAGMFYFKGGVELVHAFKKLRERHADIELTIITSLNIVNEADIILMRSVPGLTLLNATLKESEMDAIYKEHDIFVLPTYRDSFGLVLLEAISWGMPIICTDQYATAEVAIDGYNAFVYPNHPLKDYDPKTFRLLGRYYNPKDFYTDLFRLQKGGKLKSVEDFLVSSIEKFLQDPDLLRKFSQNSLNLYREKFDAQKITNQMESAFLESVNK